MADDKIRVLIADDHPVFRGGLRTLFSTVPEIEVTGEATTGDEAIEQALALQPDVVLMDIRMPNTNGIEATQRIHSSAPQIGIVMLSMLEDDDSIFAAMRYGARGYVLKGAQQDDIIRAIRAVAQGDALFSPSIAHRLPDYFASQAKGPDQLFPKLTPRELEVLNLIARRYTNGEIADILSLSGKTVRNHVSNVLSKLQVADRAQAILRAKESGLVS